MKKLPDKEEMNRIRLQAQRINDMNPRTSPGHLMRIPERTGGIFDKQQGIEPMLLSPASCRV